MSEALGEDVYHYHLHVVYIPVVKKQILWTKRCKDISLIGTVKETIMQVSRSKKWNSQQAVDEAGQPMFSKTGKPVLVPSYSVLQDTFFQAMQKAGYTDIERGKKGRKTGDGSGRQDREPSPVPCPTEEVKEQTGTITTQL